MKILNFTCLLILFLPASQTFSQIEGTNAFLKGNYVEIGINNCGVYASDDLPTGDYHPTESTGLGFIADSDMDGWDIGSPNYCGDYFVPGSPVEGWQVQIGSDVFTNTDQYCSPNDIPGEIINYEETADTVIAIWQGEIPGYPVTIIQKTTLPKNELYFITTITFLNEGPDSLFNIYYKRNIDPDNDQPWSEDYITFNKIVSNPPDSAGALVTAEGLTYGCYLALGMFNTNARVSFGNFSTTDGTAQNAWGGTGGYEIEGENTGDVAIQLTYKTDLPAFSEIEYSFAHIFYPSQVNEALLNTTDSLFCQNIDTYTIDPINGNSFAVNWTSMPLSDYIIQVFNIATSDAIEYAGVSSGFILSELDSCSSYSVQILTVCGGDTLNSPASVFNTACVTDGILNDDNKLQLSIYPNPSDGNFNLNINGLNPGTASITIKNISGEIVYSDNISCSDNLVAEITAGNLSKGVYLISVKQDNLYFNQQIVIGE